EGGGLAEAMAYARAELRAAPASRQARLYVMPHVRAAAERLARRLGYEAREPGEDAGYYSADLVRTHADGWIEYVGGLSLSVATGTWSGRRGLRRAAGALDDVCEALAQPWAEARS